MRRGSGTIHIALLLAGALLVSACGSRVTHGAAPMGAGVAAGAPTAAATPGPQGATGGETADGAPDSTAADASGTAPGTPSEVPSNQTATTTAARTGTPARSGAAPAQAAQPGAARPATRTEATSAGQPAPSSGGAPTGGAVPGNGPDAQGVTPSEIKIGVLAPISGAAGFLGEVEVSAVRAYFEMVNAQGGVNGRKYRLVVLDTQFEPTVEATATKRLVDQDKVFALLSITGDSSAPYVTSKGIPNVTLGMTPPSFSSRYPTVYPVVNVVDAVARFAYQLTQVLKKPIKSTALLYDTQNVPVAPWVKYMTKAWEIWGVQVKSTDRFNLSDADCTQLVVKMQQLGIDYWSHAQTLGWGICEQAMARQRYYPPQGRGGPYTADAFFIAQSGPSANGVIGGSFGLQIARNYGTPWPYSNNGKNPLTDAFVASMKRFSPRNADIRSLESIWAQFFWSMAKLIDDGVRAQPGAITWPGVNQWIQGQRAWVGGLLPPINFTPKCKSGSNVWLFQWNYTGQQFEQSDWQPWGGPVQLPTEAKDKIVPGAGDCYVTAMADAEL